jgi:hypothetical protein
MIGGAGCDALTGIAAPLVKQAGAEPEAPLALAPPGSKARVALERFDVAMAELDGVLELVKSHVLTSTGESFHDAEDITPGYRSRRCYAPRARPAVYRRAQVEESS